MRPSARLGIVLLVLGTGSTVVASLPADAGPAADVEATALRVHEVGMG